jgi:hypothetical protein
MSRKAAQSIGGESIPTSLRPVYDAVVALTDAFCRQYFNEEYLAMWR